MLTASSHKITKWVLLPLNNDGES